MSLELKLSYSKILAEVWDQFTTKRHRKIAIWVYIWVEKKQELASTANPYYYYYYILKNKFQKKRDKNLIKLYKKTP
jgi:hypothetical protein